MLGEPIYEIQTSCITSSKCIIEVTLFDTSEKIEKWLHEHTEFNIVMEACERGRKFTISRGYRYKGFSIDFIILRQYIIYNFMHS